MRALSLSRPWPYAVLRLGKPLDNRSRKDGKMPHICRHRGPLLLHAAKSWDNEAIRCIQPMAPSVPTRRDKLNGEPAHPAGGIVGRCVAIGHIDPDGHFWLDPEGQEDDPEVAASLDMRWWMGGYALVWTDVEPTPFVPCRGMLGLWTPPPDVLAKLGLP